LTNPTIAALFGVVVGAVLGFALSSLQGAIQSRSTHRVAVRAVLIELDNNISMLDRIKVGTLASAHASAATNAYDGLLTALLSGMPDDVAAAVAEGYGPLHSFKSFPIVAATENQATIVAARDALRRYAIARLKLQAPKSAGQ